ncbi:MAG: SDR family NAD(P)-dependent oxidoreductase [Egibacteraceae bacterium]
MEARVAVVTGGASGIGAALAAGLVMRGDIVTVADLDQQGAERTAERLRARGPGRAVGAGLDVRDVKAVIELVQSVEDEHGRIDLMFNNVGIAVSGTAEEHTLDYWDRSIEVNLRGVVHGVHAVYPIMLRQGFGHIVNTASLAGLVPAPLMTAYSATKHAVVGLSLALRAEAVSRGVRVSVVCPGFIDTPLIDNVNPGLPKTAASNHARASALRVQRKLYAPDRLASDVLRGVDRNQALIVSPAFARLMWRIARLSPSLVLRIATFDLARFRTSCQHGADRDLGWHQSSPP